MTAERIIRVIRVRILWLLLPLASPLASSCSTSQPPQAGSESHTAQWVKVKESPPTWYPRGVSADHPTDHNNGEWIYTEDEVGTRYFIPIHGLPPDRRQALLADAWASRSPEKSQRIHDEESRRKFGSAASYILGGPILSLGGMGL